MEILPGGLEDWESIKVPAGSYPPSEDFPFVLVEGNLGIPSTVITRLYLSAVAMPWFLASEDANVAFVATSVILVLNPGHQTALNTRKRLIRKGYFEPERELRYIALLQHGSADCAKQSIIWDHRRWCITYIRGVPKSSVYPYPILHHWSSSEEARLLPHVNTEDVCRELAIVYHTCESYPRNYHAWNHWHWLIDTTVSSVFRYQPGEPERRDFLLVLVDAYVDLRNWIDRHPSDYTAMHQMCQIQTTIDHLLGAGVLTQDVAAKLPSLTPVEHCLSLLTAFPAHEALWMHLRVILGYMDEESRSKMLNQSISSNAHATRLLSWFSERNR